MQFTGHILDYEKWAEKVLMLIKFLYFCHYLNSKMHDTIYCYNLQQKSSTISDKQVEEKITLSTEGQRPFQPIVIWQSRHLPVGYLFQNM